MRKSLSSVAVAYILVVVALVVAAIFFDPTALRGWAEKAEENKRRAAAVRAAWHRFLAELSALRGGWAEPQEPQEPTVENGTGPQVNETW